MIDLKTLTITKVSNLLKQKEISVAELAESYLGEIEKRDPDVHAYLEVFTDIDKQAQHAQAKIDSGSANLLTGIPLALKDNILVEGRRVGAASRILEDFIAPYDSTVARKLKEQGVVFLGRTNMDEFAMGASTENSAYGPTKNPFDLSRVPGGSSGGSASAIAMNGALVALGSDTGGSIRQPASFCGCVGLKPTYGAVSRHGLIAMASSFDQIGPLTKNVTDAEIVFNAIKGQDGMDSTSYYPEEIANTPQRLRIGVPNKILEIDGLHADVQKNFEESVNKLKDLDCEIVDVDLPTVEHALAVYYIIVPAEVSSNLSRFDGVKFGFKKEGKDLLEDYLLTRREGFGKEVRRRIMLGTYVLSAGYYDSYYGKANTVRSLIRADFNRVFEGVDVVIVPTTPTPAFALGEKANNPLAMYLADVFTVPANIAGLPAISIPSGFSDSDGVKLPLGLQCVGRPYEEATLFEVGKKFLGE